MSPPPPLFGGASPGRSASSLLAGSHPQRTPVRLRCGRQTGETANGKTLFTQTLDAVGNVTSRTDLRGATTTFEYDALYRKVTETSPSVACASGPCQAVKTALYDLAGRVTKETDAEGRVTAHVYDGLGRQTLLADALNRTVERHYDLLDRLTLEERQPQGLRTEKWYDALGRVTKEARTMLKQSPNLVATTTSAYDDHALTATTTDAEGNTSLTLFDSLGQVKSLALDPGGLNLARSYHYNGHGKVISETDPNGNATATAWDGLGRKTSVTTPPLVLDGGGHAVAVSSWSYDFAGRVTVETDPLNAEVRHEYDAFGRETSRVLRDGAGDQTLGAWTYNDQVPLETVDPAAPTSVTTDGRGLATKHWADALGREVRTEDPSGNPVTRLYDKVGNVVSQTDRRGYVVAKSYDALNRVTLTTWVGGATGTGADLSESVVYDDADNKTVTTDRMNHVHTEVRDEAGRKVEELKAPDSSATPLAVARWSYDALDRVVSATDANGNIVNTTYDAAGRKATVTSGSGKPEAYAVTYHYDKMDHVLQVTDALGQVSAATYDAGYRQLTARDGLDQATAFGYDIGGNKTSQTDATGKRTSYAYDSRHRVVQITEPGGSVTRYSYDGDNNRVAMVNAGGHLTGWVYDNLNRQTEERRYDGVFTMPPAQLPGNPAQLNQVRYDAEGNRVGVTDGNGQVYAYHPDALGREVKGDYPQPLKTDSFALSETQRAFDGLDHLVSVSETKGTLVQTRTLGWDYLGRQTRETSPYGAALSFEYDASGNRTKATLALSNLAPKIIQYGYDARNRLVSVTDATGVTTYEYGTGNDMGARPGRVWKVHHPDGSTETSLYDLADRLTSKNATDKNGQLLVSYAYTYDEAGRKLTQTENHGQGAGDEITVYTYDSAGRLASETLHDASGTLVSEHDYTYDVAGNRLTETVKDANNATTSSKSYTYNDLEQLTGMADAVTGTQAAYAYDANGNQTSKTVTPEGKAATATDFIYTTRDQLRFITVDGALKEDLLYDDLGRRIKKNGELEHWDGRSLVAETDAASGGLLRGYTHGLALLRENVLGNVVEAYADAMGSVGALVPQNGTAANAGHFRYDAYGNFRTEAHPGDCSADPSGLTCNAPLTFTGHLYDAESNLFYFGARYYDPETGRFLTNDPVAGDALNPPSLHKYLYAYDSPMVYTDPWGEQAGPESRAFLEAELEKNWTPEERARVYHERAETGKGLVIDTPRDVLKGIVGLAIFPYTAAKQSWASGVEAVHTASQMYSDYKRGGIREMLDQEGAREKLKRDAVIHGIGNALKEAVTNPRMRGRILGNVIVMAATTGVFSIGAKAEQAVALEQTVVKTEGVIGEVTENAMQVASKTSEAASGASEVAANVAKASPGAEEMAASAMKVPEAEGSLEAAAGSEAYGPHSLGAGEATTDTATASQGMMIRDVKAISARDANAPFLDEGWQPPYAEGTVVRKFTTAKEIEFVRVHTKKNPIGRFLARHDEIAGMTPEQIKQHLGLPEVPTEMRLVRVPTGTRMQMGRVAAQPKFGVPTTGGIQYQILEDLPEACFGPSEALK